MRPPRFAHKYGNAPVPDQLLPWNGKRAGGIGLLLIIVIVLLVAGRI